LKQANSKSVNLITDHASRVQVQDRFCVQTPSKPKVPGAIFN
jgi:hypothetical protein